MAKSQLGFMPPMHVAFGRNTPMRPESSWPRPRRRVPSSLASIAMAAHQHASAPALKPLRQRMLPLEQSAYQGSATAAAATGAVEQAKRRRVRQQMSQAPAAAPATELGRRHSIMPASISMPDLPVASAPSAEGADAGSDAASPSTRAVCTGSGS